MTAFHREEIEQALVLMDTLRAESSKTGDWRIWAQCLSDDVEFRDEVYGNFYGRAAVSDFVVRAHAPFAHLRYQRDWTLIDDVLGEIIMYQRLTLPEPVGYQGQPFAIDVWSRHRYAGDMCWNLKHDVTLSAKQSAEVFAAWLAAGGEFQASPLPQPE